MVSESSENDHRRGVLIFRVAPLLIPLIGGEFLPHLDEGALWVRATMPYTDFL